LKARPDVISWDESGQVKVDGKEIPDSNISDLVSDAMPARKNFNPKVAQELFCGQSKINVPKDIARNTERWNQVQMGSPSGAEEAVFKTPPPRPPPPTSPRPSKRFPIVLGCMSVTVKEFSFLFRWKVEGDPMGSKSTA
jgi:hypothetical protein